MCSRDNIPISSKAFSGTLRNNSIIVLGAYYVQNGVVTSTLTLNLATRSRARKSKTGR